MDMFKNTQHAHADLRKVTDRRIHEQKRRYDRRVLPDRRLNNISAEWIPINEITSRPTIRKALICCRNKTMASGARERKRWRAEQSLVCIFKNKLSSSVELRKVHDRRTVQQERPYNRRVQPDRRLNNISVEWISS
jgi:hypothetical protein